ncbi:MAG: hypothetical protein IIW36_05175 [Clostridia bacterium]|nr:hypothetical protein [Clostridia bacterium]MBQ5834188.1 hypothetical protein [Clostridia bacterium]
MAKGNRKQFSLSLLIRILLAVMVVVSIGIFANSLMRFNELQREEKKLEEALHNLLETREELNELMGSAESVKALLSDYERYQKAMESDSDLKDALIDWEARKAALQELINESDNKEYIVRIAKEKLGLYFPDEEIIYNDGNG